MDCIKPDFPVFHYLQSLLKLMSIELVMPSNDLMLCCPLFRLSSVSPNIRVFSNELVLCIRWPKYCSFSFSISPSNEYSGLISFRIDWFDLLAVRGTLKNLLQESSLAPQIKSVSSLTLSLLILGEHFLHLLLYYSEILNHFHYHYSEFFLEGFLSSLHLVVFLGFYLVPSSGL